MNREAQQLSEFIYYRQSFTISLIETNMVNGLHSSSTFLTSGHSKRFTILPHIQPFIYTHSHTDGGVSHARRQTSSSGAVKVRCHCCSKLSSNYLSLQLTINMRNRGVRKKYRQRLYCYPRTSNNNAEWGLQRHWRGLRSRSHLYVQTELFCM